MIYLELHGAIQSKYIQQRQQQKRWIYLYPRFEFTLDNYFNHLGFYLLREHLIIKKPPKKIIIIRKTKKENAKREKNASPAFGVTKWRKSGLCKSQTTIFAFLSLLDRHFV